MARIMKTLSPNTPYIWDYLGYSMDLGFPLSVLHHALITRTSLTMITWQHPHCLPFFELLQADGTGVHTLLLLPELPLRQGADLPAGEASGAPPDQGNTALHISMT